MISKFACLGKMLQKIIIFSLLFVSIHGDGKFAVLKSSESIEFHGEQPILGDDVAEVILAATGNTVNGNAQWTGLSIADPFNLPTKAVVAFIEGASFGVKSAKFEVPLTGSGASESLNILVEEMKETGTSVCDIDFSSKHSSKALHKCFGISSQTNEATLPATVSLNAEDTAVKPFLRAIADLSDAVDEYQKLKKTKAGALKSVVVVRISLVPIVNAYGECSAQQTEAVELVKKTIAKMEKVSGDALFIAVSDAGHGKSRSKRETVAADPENKLNLAKYYSSDYPVIFNIILWFMIVFGLALLAISYAIGSMDPGRDSIIYRMTSTRMKKDN